MTLKRRVARLESDAPRNKGMLHVIAGPAGTKAEDVGIASSPSDLVINLVRFDDGARPEHLSSKPL